MIDIEIRQISIKSILSEISLLQKYSVESKGSFLPGIKPDVLTYVNLENSNTLYSFGVFSKDQLVGFLTFIVSPMIHYSMPVATVESIFILKEYRKFGTAKKLLRKAEDLSKQLGITLFSISAPVNGALDKAAVGLGFTKTNTVFMRAL